MQAKLSLFLIAAATVVAAIPQTNVGKWNGATNECDVGTLNCCTCISARIDAGRTSTYTFTQAKQLESPLTDKLPINLELLVLLLVLSMALLACNATLSLPSARVVKTGNYPLCWFWLNVFKASTCF
jgi:hypothetical protein